MKNKAHSSGPEFSRPIVVDKIPPSGLLEHLEAKPKECQLLAERFGLPDLTHLHADLEVGPSEQGGVIAVTGLMVADLVQTCVVTLEPLPAHIEHTIDVIFASPEQIESGEELDADGPEVEPILEGMIDLGELVAQNLGIVMDPYPRKPGLAPVKIEYGDMKAAPPGPFAKLVELKKPKD